MDLSGFLNEWNNGADCISVQTSGSTGTPKRMDVEKSRMLSSAKRTCDFLGLKKGDRALLCLPLDYIAGKMMVVRALERSMELVCVDPSNHPMAGAEGNFDLVAMVPSQVFCTLQIPREAEALKKVRNLIIGGGAVSGEIERAVSGFPNAVWSTYGMTETLSHIALRRLSGPRRSDWYESFDSVSLSADEESCLVIDAPELSGSVLRTNDIVEFGEDFRHFKVLGRRDNVICSGGIKIQAETVERKLEGFISGKFCISRRPDPKFGEAVVLLVEGECSDTVFSAAGLDKFERPRHIVVVDRIPLTPNGKIDRKAVGKLAEGADQAPVI